jgi:decaprenylphospho-beta-D-ribofuranose 2-oxidase
VRTGQATRAVGTELSGTRRVLTGFGRIRRSESFVVGLPTLERLQELVAARPKAGLVARGAGLSYGDAAQNSGGVVVSPVTAPTIQLDPAQATVTAAAGTTFAQILRQIVPAGFILPVLPATARLTVGGAIAADVHGKNHRQAGSLSAWLEDVDLLDGTGELHRLTMKADPAGLRATVGGMGLTGIVLRATIRLRRIETAWMLRTAQKTDCLDSTLAQIEAAADQYSIGWIDATARGAALGRGIVSRGDHASRADAFGADLELRYQPRSLRHVPAMPVSLVTPHSALAVNSVVFKTAPADRSGLVGLASFFHGMDRFEGWTRTVAPGGLIQYQFVVPTGAESVLAEVLQAMHACHCAPVLTTLRRLGVSSGGPLSFPVPGWCLTVDIPARHPRLGVLLTKIDLRIASAGGRSYLANDGRLSRYAFEAMYGPAAGWRAVRARPDPHGLFQSDLGRRVGLC